jgi:hypothetical protein
MLAPRAELKATGVLELRRTPQGKPGNTQPPPDDFNAQQKSYPRRENDGTEGIGGRQGLAAFSHATEEEMYYPDTGIFQNYITL